MHGMNGWKGNELMRDKVGWKVVTDEGVKRDIVASRTRNEWSFRYQEGRADEWHEIKKPTLEHWEALLDLLERKYQRRRCAWRDVEQVKDCLARAREGR